MRAKSLKRIYKKCKETNDFSINWRKGGDGLTNGMGISSSVKYPTLAFYGECFPSERLSQGTSNSNGCHGKLGLFFKVSWQQDSVLILWLALCAKRIWPENNNLEPGIQRSNKQSRSKTRNPAQSPPHRPCQTHWPQAYTCYNSLLPAATTHNHVLQLILLTRLPSH